MKYNLFSKLLSLGIGIAVAIGASYVYAAVHTEPSTSFPNGNLEVPINAETVNQIKNGGLSVDAFIAAQNALFSQQAFIKGMVRGGTPATTDSRVNVGGFDTTGALKSVETTVQGEVTAASIASRELSNSALSKLCANEEGKVVLCGAIASALVTEWAQMHITGGAGGIGFAPPGWGTGPGGTGLPSGISYPVVVTDPGFSFSVAACLDRHYTVDKTVTIRWTDSQGTQRQTVIVVYADPLKNTTAYPDLFGTTNSITWGDPQKCSKVYVVTGPATGVSGTSTNICMRPADTSIPVTPAQQC